MLYHTSVLYSAFLGFTTPLCALQCFPRLYHTYVLYIVSLCIITPLCFTMLSIPVLCYCLLCFYWYSVSGQCVSVCDGKFLPSSAGSEKEKGVDSDEENSSSHCGGRQTHSAFLGPLLWEKTLPCEGGLFQLQYMDLEEFLTENGMGPQTSSMAAQIPSQNSQSAIPNQSGQSQSGQPNQSSQHPGQLSQLSQLARAPSPTSPLTPSNGQPSVAVETGGSSRAVQTQGMMGGGCIQGAAHPGKNL
ncbi:HLF factor, partial [Polyodon spathula]|nr:HLF factor [Polyodon spathula]